MKYGLKTKGFTIVELMVTLAVAAILMGFAVPAFNDFLTQRRMASAINDFVLAVNYARSEAARVGRLASVQSLGADAGNEWGEGYCVVVGNPGNCDDALRRFSPVDDATLDAMGGGFHGVYTLSFNARGMLTPQPAGPGALQLCSTDPDVNPGRVANVSLVGRPDVEELVCP